MNKYTIQKAVLATILFGASAIASASSCLVPMCTGMDQR